MLALRQEQKIRRILKSFRRLMDARFDYPVIMPREFWVAGTYPAAKWQVKLYILVLRPRREWYREWRRQEDAALDAVRLLEARHGVTLDWAAGVRDSGTVWVFIKPLAFNKKGRRVWFRITPDDLDALRGLCPAAEQKAGQKRAVKVIRGREGR